MNNIFLLDMFFKAVNEQNLNAMQVLFNEKTEFYFPKTQPLIGSGRIIRFFRILFRQYPELSFTTLTTIVEGVKAAVHWKNKGVNRRGEPYENEGVTIFEEKDGVIRFMSDFFKDTEKF